MVEPMGVYELLVDNLYLDDGRTYKAGLYPILTEAMSKHIKDNHIHDGAPVYVFHPEVVDEFDPDGDKGEGVGDGTDDALASGVGDDPGSPEPVLDTEGEPIVEATGQVGVTAKRGPKAK